MEFLMTYDTTINNLANDPEQLEQAYQAALRAGEAEAFRNAIESGRTAAPDNLLYAAWYYRLRETAVKAKESFIAWGWAIPLALLNGLVLWFLSDDARFGIEIAGIRRGSLPTNYIPMVFLLAAPVTAVFVLAYLTPPGRRNWRQAVIIGTGLLAAAVYVIWVYPQAGTRPYQEQYLTLMAMHLPLLAWAGVGALVVFRDRDAGNRFAFLVKSLEVFVMGG